MPTFESLRSTRGRSAVDLLVGGPVPAERAPAPAPVAAPAPAAGPSPPAGRTAPRPAEYGDLLRFGLRAARALAGLPGCALHRLRAALGG
jgi:hypothetical protein